MRHIYNLHLMCPDMRKKHVSLPVDCQNVPMAQMFCTLSKQTNPHAVSPSLTVHVLTVVVVGGHALDRDWLPQTVHSAKCHIMQLWGGGSVSLKSASWQVGAWKIAVHKSSYASHLASQESVQLVGK